MYQNGKLLYQDYASEYLNIVNGKRIVTNKTNNNENCVNKVKIFGDSRIFGICTIDDYTIQSFLQEKLSNKYTVENCSVQGIRHSVIYNQIINEELNKGDIVIINNIFCELSEECNNDMYSIES